MRAILVLTALRSAIVLVPVPVFWPLEQRAPDPTEPATAAAPAGVAGTVTSPPRNGAPKPDL